MVVLLRSAQRAYEMLGSGEIWATAQRCHEVLQQNHVPYAIVGGVAVCLHGYQRSTIDVDILVRPADTKLIRKSFEESGFVWHPEAREFRDQNDVPVQFLISNEPAGDDASLGIRLPEPDAVVTTEIEGLRVVSLARLIELKLACGLGNMRRTHRDFADVVELIDCHQLGRDFARFLAKSVRREFRALVQRARGELDS